MILEPRHDKSNKMGVRAVWSVFAVRMMKAWVLSYPLSAQRRLWSDWADAQADLSLRWAHRHFVGFVMSRLTSYRVTWHRMLLNVVTTTVFDARSCRDISTYRRPLNETVWTNVFHTLTKVNGSCSCDVTRKRLNLPTLSSAEAI